MILNAEAWKDFSVRMKYLYIEENSHLFHVNGRKSEYLIKPIILWHSFQHAHMTCPCGEEAMKKYSQILYHFEEVYAILALVGMNVFLELRS